MVKRVCILFSICSLFFFLASCNNTDTQIEKDGISTEESVLHEEAEIPTIDTGIAEDNTSEMEIFEPDTSENQVQYSQYSELESLLRDLSENLTD